MRVAVLIIGLVLMIGLFAQSLTVNVLSEVVNEEESATAGAAGVLMATAWLVAIALVLPKPRISTAVFVIAGLWGVLFAATTDFSDLWMWSVISFLLAGMSYLGYRSKMKDQAKEDERDNLLRQMTAFNQLTAMAAVQQTQGPPPPIPAASRSPTYCVHCGRPLDPGAKFCAECGGSTGG